MIRKILRFTKIEHTAFSLPLLFTGAWLGAGGRWPSPEIIAFIVMAAVGARIFGMACNRIFDRHIDARNPRTAARELPSGGMRIRTAWGVAIGGLSTYLFACLLLGHWCFYLAPLPLIPLLGYSLLKRVTALCHFGIGLCLALAPLGAFVAASGSVRFSPDVIFFAGFVFFWLSGADIIYALMDIDSDRRNGIHSLPARLGARHAQIVAAGSHAIALICLFSLLVIAKADPRAFAALLLTAILFVFLYLPFIPVPKRFFPLATLAGVAGALTPLLA